MIKKLLITSTVLSVLSGCTIVGEEEGTCPGAKSGVACASVREVYELTNVYNNADEYAKATGDERVLVTDDEGNLISGKEYKEKYGTKEEKKLKMSAETQAQDTQVFSNAPQLAQPEAAYQHLLLPAPEPVAMRKPADIVRILVRPYVDKNDALQVPGYGYLEAEQRTWVVDRNAKTNDSQYVNLHVRKESQQQDYGVNDDGQIGVESRNGKQAKAPNSATLQEQAHQSATSLINQLRN